MIESSDAPHILRQKVMSPGGTTEAAMKSMDEAKVKAQVEAAVLAAWKRSQELGKSD